MNTPRDPAAGPSALDRLGHNLVADVREGKLPAVLGREREIARVMQVLCMRTKNSPILVGERAVGRTDVVTGLAHQILRGDVPRPLRDKQLYVLDLTATGPLAGAQDPSKLLADGLEEATARGDVILFVDELRALLSPGPGDGGINVASILKPALTGGGLQIIGATTQDEYHHYLSKDAALERRFQPIQVTELTLAHTIEVLKGQREIFEAHHRVSIDDDAVVAAARLADLYIEGHLPDKAIGLLDEAGSRAAIRRMFAPPDVREYEEKISNVRGQKEAAIDTQDFEKAAALRDKEKQLLADRRAHEKAWKSDPDAVGLVDADVILEVLAATTGIPVAELRNELTAAEPVLDAPAAVVEDAHEYVLLNDEPVAGDSEDGDLLGSSEIAAGIASMLTASRKSAPFVVAVDAGWGMGKSTLLRQIESRLPGRPSVVMVRFNAWTAQGENALEGLIKSVLVELDRVVVRRWLKQLAQRRRTMLIARLTFSLLARFFGLTRLVDELWNRLSVDAKSRNELRGLIHDMLSDWVGADRSHDADPRRTLVVFIDDLDRCSDDVIIKLCEAVKLYLDAPGIVFVIACDLSVLARGVSKSPRGATGDGRAYLEKIVQVAYRLPPPDEARIKRLIAGYAKSAGTEQLIDDTTTQILIERTGHNPRRIKRIINSLVLEHRLNPAWRQAPLDSAQLVRAILVQHLYTPFYDILISDEAGDDPIGEFLDYADVRARAADPPAADHPWWTIASRTFHRHGMPAPVRVTGAGQDVLAQVATLESELPEPLPALARNSAFVALLRGVGGPSTRRALRAQLISRPLGTAAMLDSPDE